jgi:hypothetical protein
MHRMKRTLNNPTFRFLVDPNLDGTPGVIPPAPRMFTQDEVNALAAREKDQGRVAGLREASEKLGGRTIDDAAVLIAAAVAADEANKTEAQRELAAAATAKSAAEQDRAEAAKDRHTARLERILGKAGASDVEIVARALDVAVGADDATVTAAVEALKAKVPGMFVAVVPPPNTDPGKQPPPAGGLASAAAQAADIAKARGWTV